MFYKRVRKGLNIVKNKLNGDTNKNIMMYIIIGILSAIIFCMIYGITILNPTYTDWLLSGGDLSQHYLGWKAYRGDQWHFPIGMTNKLAYPNYSSIIFTDSIPIFAVLFKILSPILPKNFQYFGFWGLMCFILQGIFSARILKKYTKDKILIIIASIIFSVTPVVIWRMYAHTALAGQWILLFALETIFNYEYYNDNKKIYLSVGLIGALSASIHMYFVLMNGIVLIGYMTLWLLNKKEIKRCILLLVEYLLIVALIVGLLGGFTVALEASSSGLGEFSFNLNGFFNPQGWSKIFKDLPLYGTGQYEGFAYLGAGFIYLLVMVFVVTIEKYNIKKEIIKNWKTIFSIGIVGLVAIIVAVSPVITINSLAIMEIKIPVFIRNIWNIFRSSGRVVWIADYIIMLGSIIVIIKAFSKRTVIIVLLSSIMIQIYDLQDALIEKNKIFNRKKEYETLLTDTSFWNEIKDNKEIKHLVYNSSVATEMQYSLTDWALQNGKTVNDFGFARSTPSLILANRDRSLEEKPKDTIFIFNEQESISCLKYKLHYYLIDGLIIGYCQSIKGIEEIIPSNIQKWEFANNIFIDSSNGQDTEKGREIYPGGISYGPYWNIPKGKYDVVIDGVNIPQDVNIAIYSQKESYNFNIVSRSKARINIEVSFEEEISGLEIVIKNNSQETVILKNIQIEFKGE